MSGIEYPEMSQPQLVDGHHPVNEVDQSDQIDARNVGASFRCE